jgi:hypothetical protein
MDTGSTIVTLPQSTFSALATTVNATVDDAGNFIVDCSTTMPSIALRIGGKDYSFSMEELMLEVVPINSTALAQASGLQEGSLACVLPFTAGGDTPQAIVSHCHPFLLNSSLYLTLFSSEMPSSSPGRLSTISATGRSVWPLPHLHHVSLPYRTWSISN